jgi:hypothetical protein
MFKIFEIESYQIVGPSLMKLEGKELFNSIIKSIPENTGLRYASDLN